MMRCSLLTINQKSVKFNAYFPMKNVQTKTKFTVKNVKFIKESD